ncbi:MAG: rhodanese-like domain-containing protein [bacterium]
MGRHRWVLAALLAYAPLAANAADTWKDRLGRDPVALRSASPAFRDRVARVARRESCPCGCKMDLLLCLEEDKSCPLRPEHALRVAAIADALAEDRTPPPAPDANQPSVEAIARDRAISADDAKRLHDAGVALFVDARKPKIFAAAHLPGAVNLDAEDMKAEVARLAPRLKAARTIVTYCPAKCMVSALVAQRLMAAGYKNVRVLQGGWDAWIRRKFSVETGS